MARETTILDQEQARLEQGAAKPGYFERKRALYERQTADLAQRLLPDVTRALTEEATSDIADQWLTEASAALRAAIPELPAEPRAEPEFQAALDKMRASLSDSLRKDVLAPTKSEIDEHAHELAQLLLGNWFAILEHTQADDSREAIALTINGLPLTVDQPELYEGVEAFAVPKDQLVGHFVDYLDSLVQPGAVTELAPDRLLVAKGTERFLVRSQEAAKRLLENPISVDDVDEVLIPVLDPAPAFFGRAAPRGAALIEPTLERDVAIAAAYRAAHETNAEFDANVTELEARGHKVDLTLQQPEEKLSADLAELAVLKVKIMQAGMLPKLILRRKQAPLIRKIQVEALGLVKAEALSTLCRVSVAAAGYALARTTENELPKNFNFQAVEDFVHASTKGRELYKISVRAAQNVLERPESLAVANEFRTMLGGRAKII